MRVAGESLYCVYCMQPVGEDDDAQRVSKRDVAHTVCAFAVNDACFAALDAESESGNDD